MTRIVSVFRAGPEKSAEYLADDAFIYAGRPLGRWRGIGLGNPFNADDISHGSNKGGRAAARLHLILMTRGVQAARTAAIQVYRRIPHIPSGPELEACRDRTIELLPSLRGKTLGCWCGDGTVESGSGPVSASELAEILMGLPQCHATTLALLAEGLIVVGGPGAPKTKAKTKAKARGDACRTAKSRGSR